MKQPNPNQLKNDDQKIVEPNVLLETDKQHKDWYDPTQMGKSRGRPVGRPSEIRKPKGTRKHSMRKEK